LSTDSSLDQEDSDLGALGKPAFPTMCVPSATQVGHYIYLRCGHNGNFLNIERKVYERHLLRAGCLNPQHLQRNNSDMTLSFVAATPRSQLDFADGPAKRDSGDLLGHTLDLRPSLFR
jgi:hypothetical protein